MHSSTSGLRHLPHALPAVCVSATVITTQSLRPLAIGITQASMYYIKLPLNITNLHLRLMNYSRYRWEMKLPWPYQRSNNTQILHCVLRTSLESYETQKSLMTENQFTFPEFNVGLGFNRQRETERERERKRETESTDKKPMILLHMAGPQDKYSLRPRTTES